MTSLAPLLLALTLGCNSEPATTQAPAAPAVEQAAPQKASQKILGEWQVNLGEEQQAQLKAMKLAFQDPAPTEEQIKAAGLSDEETMMVGMILMARSKDPNDPKLAEMRAMLDQMKDAKVVITADKITMAIGPQTQENAYTVSSETETELKVSMTGEDGTPSESTIKLVDDKTLEITEAGSAQPLRLTRG